MYFLFLEFAFKIAFDFTNHFYQSDYITFGKIYFQGGNYVLPKKFAIVPIQMKTF